ncbi:DUF2057 family protein [Gallaecimonas kandeliae]|uniref:DUF2057 family protein n=1 Tax=Gallaecimonas kandeliae TaxID=3029055 RepID=UPI00264774B2|nr:DUF2057 family protein [Gallaecimonas kandeliae]WKE64458.1 DUF2057 family protein [Gallaecimonas kandeliae]
MRLLPLLSLSLVTLSLHAAELKLAEPVYVHQLDGQEVKNFLWQKTDKLNLAPGKHQLKVSYSKIFDDGFESYTKVNTDERWISIQVPAEGSYLLTTPPLDDLEAAQAFAEKPQFILKSAAGDSQAAKALAAPVAAKPQPRPQGEMTQQLSATDQNMAEQQLHYWYQQADDATKARFKAWLKEH